MAPRYDLSASIGGREIIHGHDGGERDHRPRSRHGVEKVVRVKWLRCLARADLDGLARREQKSSGSRYFAHSPITRRGSTAIFQKTRARATSVYTRSVR